MFHVEKTEGSKEKKYELLLKQIDALTEGEPDMIANTANASALLYQSLEDVNWAGFYFAKDGEPCARAVPGTSCMRKNPVRERRLRHRLYKRPGRAR